jgi:hypothetical protein
VLVAVVAAAIAARRERAAAPIARSAAPPPAVAELTIESKPAGARVLLDDREQATPTPATIVIDHPRADEHHRLELRLPGYRSWTAADVTLQPGAHSHYRAELVVERKPASPAPRFGTIDLHVDPWAVVYLDGKKVGEAPVKGLTLPLGHHRLKLVNPVRHKQMMLAVDVPGKQPYRVRLP